MSGGSIKKGDLALILAALAVVVISGPAAAFFLIRGDYVVGGILAVPWIVLIGVYLWNVFR